MSQLRINEIFFSVQGESVRSGLPTVFIRLSGCPLRCTYCDTEYAFKGGQRMSIEQLVQVVRRYPTKYITITGGEPLAQKEPCLALMTTLCDEGYDLSIETSGAFDISEIDPRVMVVMDLKTPSSGEESKNLFSNLACLKPTDQIKFVIGSEEDYQWAKALITDHQLDKQCQLLVSPVWESIAFADLASWVLADGLPVRYQVQLHKVIWPEHYGPGV